MDELYTGKRRSVLVTISLVIFLIMAIMLISSFWPKYEQQFVEMGLLGKDKLADDYFSNDNSTVLIHSQVDWYIFFHNHMEGSKNVLLKVKLLNSSMVVSNDQKYEPSPFGSFTELELFLDENETLLVPFFWSIEEASSQNNLFSLKYLMVNDKIVEVDVSTFSDSFFQMVFELWIYDASSQEYKFEWSSGNFYSSVSLHIGFRVADPSIFL